MKIFVFVINMILSTSIVFAGPGVSGYSNKIPAVRKAQIKRAIEQKENNKKKLIRDLNLTISKFENTKDDKLTDEIMDKIQSTLEKNTKTVAKNAKNLLRDKNKMILAFNEASALDAGLTQYQFKRKVIKLAKQENKNEVKKKVIAEVKRAGSISNYLKDFLIAVETDTVNKFIAKDSNKEKQYRSLASLSEVDAGMFFQTFAIVSLLMMTAGFVLVGGAYTIGVVLIVAPVAFLFLILLGLGLYEAIV